MFCMSSKFQMRLLAVCAVALAARLSPAASAPAGDAAKGKQVFQQCVACHAADSNQKKVGPGLKGLFKKDKLADGKKPSDASVRARIDEGGKGMPPYKTLLSQREKEDLLAYLKTL